MADVFSQSERSRVMAAVKSSGTKPEQAVAMALESMGVRYERDVAGLPGKPDFLVRRSPAKRAAQASARSPAAWQPGNAGLIIFVHGCFWHGHGCPRGRRVPKTNTDYWVRKVARNVRRDRRAARQLRAMGYSVYTLWECRIGKGRPVLPERLVKRLTRSGE